MIYKAFDNGLHFWTIYVYRYFNVKYFCNRGDYYKKKERENPHKKEENKKKAE